MGFRKEKFTSYTLKKQSFQYAQPASMLKIQLIATQSQLVEELRYKREGRGFDSQWCH